MPRAKLTKPFVKSAEHTGDGNQTLWYDDGPGSIRGLVLRCTSGSKVWCIEYKTDRNRSGPRRRLTIARWEDLKDPSDARELAEELLAGLVKDGLDPREALLPNRGDSLAAVAGRYLEDLRERAEQGRGAKRSGYETAKGRLTKHVIEDPIGRTRIGDVTREQVRRWHAAQKATPSGANRTLSCLSAVFGFAQAEGSVADLTNPVKYVPRFEETGERRALTRDELERLGKALAEAERDGHVTVEREAKGKGKTRKIKRTIHPSAILAVRLLALGGFRRGEIVGSPMKNRRNGKDGLRWGDVDLAGGTVRLRDTKTGAQRRVIGKPVLALLAAAKPADASDDDPVCPGRVRDKKSGRRLPMSGLDKARQALWEAAGIPLERGVDLHSLRHSFASLGATLHNGAYVGAVAPLLGHRHVKAGVTERYITGEADGLRGAADRISAEIAGLLGLDLPDVTAIRGSES